MTGTPGLFAYNFLAAMRAPAVRRRIAKEVARGGAEAKRQAERLGRASQLRPDGPLIWFHASFPSEEGALLDLVKRLSVLHEKASFLLTTDQDAAQAGDPPGRLIHQFIPQEAHLPIEGFLSYWRPTIGFWAGLSLRPALLAETFRRGIPMNLIDASTGPILPTNWPKLNSSTLKKFKRLLATEHNAAEHLIEKGAAPDTVEAVGPLQEEAQTLPCSQTERNTIGTTLKARPVWLATSVSEAEEDLIIAAHRRASSLAHRLILILSPQSPERAPIIAKRLIDEGFTVAQRAVEGEPDATTEIFVADSEDDLGLWYRLAPITFMGNTLDIRGTGGRSPLEPAALGSAILHGPNTGPHSASYARFTQAAAARRIESGKALGKALSELLAPDKLANMAHAAWRVSTGGADLTERIIELVTEKLDQKENP